ncbi:MAG: hypothetical protein ACXWOW_10130 [Candidatus Limnocylindrales bacterium]
MAIVVPGSDGMGPGPSASPSSVGGAGPVTPGGGGSGPTTLAGLTAGLPSIGSAAWFELMARQTALAAGVTTMMAMALFTFRRRQEDGDGDSEVDPARYEAPPRLSDELADHYVATLEAASVAELAMPRWRRPSLRAARQAQPGADLDAIEAERLTFAHGVVAPEPGLERRWVRYRMVRLGDAPDEILSNELGRLDEGDEVELLQRSGVYWQVRTPLGQVGWVHKMTLGEAVAASGGAPATRAASGGAGDGWEDGDERSQGEGLAQRLVEGHFQL